MDEACAGYFRVPAAWQTNGLQSTIDLAAVADWEQQLVRAGERCMI
jgi:hypothetical protein